MKVARFSKFFRFRVMKEPVTPSNRILVNLLRAVGMSRMVSLRALSILSKFLYSHSKVESKDEESLRPVLICGSCLGASVQKEWVDGSLEFLYLDYRSPSYVKERSTFQPTYSLISRSVGRSRKELKSRSLLMNEFLSDIDVTRVKSVLDYGGFGQFRFSKLSHLDIRKFDISQSEQLETSAQLSMHQLFDFVQCTHVLEHVEDLAGTVGKLRSVLNPNGMLYVEVPMDLSEETLMEWASQVTSHTTLITEHIHFFTKDSLLQLMKTNGFVSHKYRLVDTDFGWHRNLVHQACFLRKEP